MNNIKLKRFLKNCHELEGQLARGYRSLTQKEELNASTRTLFAAMEQQANRHGERLWDKSQQSEADIGPPPEYRSVSKELSRQIEKTLDTLVAGAVDDLMALRLMRRLELGFWNFHLENALFFEQVKLKKLFVEISSEKRAHITELEKQFMVSSTTATIHRQVVI
jgi:rubrerythrin